MPTWSCRCARHDSEHQVLGFLNPKAQAPGVGSRDMHWKLLALCKRWGACKHSAHLQMTASHACP